MGLAQSAAEVSDFSKPPSQWLAENHLNKGVDSRQQVSRAEAGGDEVYGVGRPLVGLGSNNYQVWEMSSGQ